MFSFTLAQINREIRRRLPAKPNIDNWTVARTLVGMLFRVKLVRPIPPDRNRPEVLQRRRDFANWLINLAGVVRLCVFVDECGYNFWTARCYGRARLGKRAYRQVCGQRGRNLTVGLAISAINGQTYFCLKNMQNWSCVIENRFLLHECHKGSVVRSGALMIVATAVTVVHSRWWLSICQLKMLGCIIFALMIVDSDSLLTIMD